MNHVPALPIIVNQYRRFGEIGPVYQILSHGRVDEFGDQWINVQLVESGEEVEYEAVHAADDPIEA